MWGSLGMFGVMMLLSGSTWAVQALAVLLVLIARSEIRREAFQLSPEDREAVRRHIKGRQVPDLTPTRKRPPS